LSQSGKTIPDNLALSDSMVLILARDRDRQ
jgi:hypothetical protein